MAARRPTAAERDDLESRIEALKEALRDLLWIKQMEEECAAPLAETRPLWLAAWGRARDALNEDGPDDRRAA